MVRSGPLPLLLWAAFVINVARDTELKRRRASLLEKPGESTAEGKRVRYGPDDCVSTWVGENKHCMMETDCKADAIKDYEFAMICLDGGGEKTKHVFGKGSFDSKETFDTLLACSACLADSDGVSPRPSMSKPLNLQKENLREVVHGLVVEVRGLRVEMKDSMATLEKIESAVSKSKRISTEAPTDTTSPAEDAKVGAKEAQFYSRPRLRRGPLLRERYGLEDGEEASATLRGVPRALTARAALRSLQREMDEDDAEADRYSDEPTRVQPGPLRSIRAPTPKPKARADDVELEDVEDY